MCFKKSIKKIARPERYQTFPNTDYYRKHTSLQKHQIQGSNLFLFLFRSDFLFFFFFPLGRGGSSSSREGLRTQSRVWQNDSLIQIQSSRTLINEINSKGAVWEVAAGRTASHAETLQPQMTRVISLVKAASEDAFMHYSKESAAYRPVLLRF